MVVRAGTRGAVRNAAKAVAELADSQRAVDGLVARLGEAKVAHVRRLLDEVGGVSLPVRSSPQAGGDHGHVVTFFEDVPALVGTVVPFLRPALESGGTALVVATRRHLDATLAGLEADGCDTGGALAAGALRVFDADAALSRFMVGSHPDPVRFTSVLGRVVADAARRGGGVRVYGEMVALLWEQGSVQAAIEVEQLWNRIAVDQRFALLCGYPLGVLQGGHDRSLRAMCGEHDGLVPGRAGAGAST